MLIRELRAEEAASPLLPTSNLGLYVLLTLSLRKAHTEVRFFGFVFCLVFVVCLFFGCFFFFKEDTHERSNEELCYPTPGQQDAWNLRKATEPGFGYRL